MSQDSLLFRQAHPLFVDKGLPTSQVFVPNSGDNNKLSADDANKTSAKDSYEHYTIVLKKESDSVWALGHCDVSEQNFEIEENPLEDNPAHMLINFGNLSKNAARRVGKLLKIKAIERGCQYRPPER